MLLVKDTHWNSACLCATGQRYTSIFILSQCYWPKLCTEIHPSSVPNGQRFALIFLVSSDTVLMAKDTHWNSSCLFAAGQRYTLIFILTLCYWPKICNNISPDWVLVANVMHLYSSCLCAVGQQFVLAYIHLAFVLLAKDLHLYSSCLSAIGQRYTAKCMPQMILGTVISTLSILPSCNSPNILTDIHLASARFAMISFMAKLVH